MPILLQSSLTETDLKVPVDNKWNMSQWCSSQPHPGWLLPTGQAADAAKWSFTSVWHMGGRIWSHASSFGLVQERHWHIAVSPAEVHQDGQELKHLMWNRRWKELDLYRVNIRGLTGGTCSLQLLIGMVQRQKPDSELRGAQQ